MSEIPDTEVLRLSQSFRIGAGEAASLAIEMGLIPERYKKNLGIISTSDQARICKSKILVCGCGGLGGHVIFLLVRLGFGFLRIIDPDRFDPSNLNRQPFCTGNTLYQLKATATKEILLGINPLVDVEAIVGPFDSSHLTGVDLVIDGLDNPRDRIRAEEEALRKGIPFIHGAVRGWWGQVTTVMPDGKPKLSSLYRGVNEEVQEYEEKTGTLAPVVSLIASIQVHEALRLITGKSPLYAGKLFYWDGENGTSITVPL